MEENVAQSMEQTALAADCEATLKVVDGAKKKGVEETEETKRMKENFHFFGPATAMYAIFYAFCMYKNSSGITFPFFLASSLCYFIFSMKRLGVTLKKGSVYYMISVMLLAISTFCTDDARIIAYNKTGIFLLMLSFLLTQFFKTEAWGLGKYLASMVELLFGSLTELARPVQDCIHYSETHQSKEKRRVYYVLLGLLIAVPLLLVVAALLASADAVFRQVVDRITIAVNFDNVFGVILTVVLWHFGVYMLVANLCNKSIREEVKDHRNGEPLLAITITSVLSLLYLFFSWIQIVALFLGKMQLPDGYTYAEYAREGFFQLLAVAVMNLIIVLLCLTFFRESKVLKAVLSVMSLCTFVMIASSGMRMVLYIQSYNLTFLRIFVLWALVVLSFLFVGVLLCIYWESFPLFRYSVAVVTCLYIVLAFSHPDYLTARVNLENANGRTDYEFLSRLSADAAPALLPYLKELGYDMSVVDIPLKTVDQKDDRSYERGEHFDPYWDEVKSVAGGNKSRYQKNGFGYFYLERLREYKRNMGFRNFNLSRWLAVEQAK